MDLSLPYDPRSPVLKGLRSLAGAALIAVLVPVVLLLIGLPFALVIRGLAELLARLFG